MLVLVLFLDDEILVREQVFVTVYILLFVSTDAHSLYFAICYFISVDAHSLYFAIFLLSLHCNLLFELENPSEVIELFKLLMPMIKMSHTMMLGR